MYSGGIRSSKLILLSRNIFLSALLLMSHSALAQSDNSLTTVEIPLKGYVESPEILGLANRLASEFLAQPFRRSSENDFASAIVVYIGASLVDEGKFVPPKDYHIPEMQLGILVSSLFPDEGCQVRRLMFPSENKFIVLLVDATDQPTADYTEQCLLLSILSALGEDMNNSPTMSSDQLRRKADEIVALHSAPKRGN